MCSSNDSATGAANSYPKLLSLLRASWSSLESLPAVTATSHLQSSLSSFLIVKVTLPGFKPLTNHLLFF